MTSVVRSFSFRFANITDMSDVEKIVVVFGVFDIVHAGHRYFLAEAKKLGTELVVAVAHDNLVFKLKGMAPENTLSQRIDNLSRERIADKILPGDLEMNTWSILLTHRPSIIALGYDQETLGTTLTKYINERKLNIKLNYIKPYLDGSLHSSKLRQKKND